MADSTSGRESSPARRVDSLRRRECLTGVGAILAAGLAGCNGALDAENGDGAASTTTGVTDSPRSATTTETTDTAPRETEPIDTATGDTETTGTVTTTSDDLDLREANVVGVSVASTNDGAYRFDVTLYHDDDGEDGYANWWQVETRAGERLGRRDLLHAHGTRPFTRSASVSVPETVATVVIRGHDQTHGYGGHAMAVVLDTGATTIVEDASRSATIAE